MARRRIRVRPGRAASLMSFVVGIAFVVIGLVAVIPMAGPFGLLWTGVAVAITVMNGVNAFGKKGVASMEIETEEPEAAPAEEETHDHIPPMALDVRERLEQLKDLREAGLITGEEYETKREEILRDL